MGLYAIGLGGTGAKCIEALTHLCAVGLMPRDDLYILFVDPDTKNGCLERADKLLKIYQKCQQIPMGMTPIFQTHLMIAGEKNFWSPFQEQGEGSVLRDFFHYSLLEASHPSAAHLFRVLYSDSEMDTQLDHGFRAHPSIGAAVFAKTVQLGQEEPWRTLWNRIERDANTGESRIIIFGSIFGGTGAAGIPTIAKLIRAKLSKMGIKSAVRIGAVLMLPYFTFDQVKDKELRANPEDFLLSTKAALRYYHMQGDLKVYDSIYMLGEERLSELGPKARPGRDAKGGQEQNNEPHFLELQAALAARDFFKRKQDGCWVIARHSSERLSWNDLPYDEEKDTEPVKEQFSRFCRFALAYRASFQKSVEEVMKNRKLAYRVPWYVKFFEQEGIDRLSPKLDELKTYMDNFLLWVANIQSSAKDTINVELINWRAFAEKKEPMIGEKPLVMLKAPEEIDVREFGSLSLPEMKDESQTLSLVWWRLSNMAVKDKQASDIGKFVRALYDACCAR